MVSYSCVVIGFVWVEAAEMGLEISCVMRNGCLNVGGQMLGVDVFNLSESVK
ncbi:MAG: hypothetical protein ACI9W2_001477 [Gammaproteobacteria bacterium]|jgi:hypothetical protein